MSQKAIKKRTIESLRSSPQLKHQTQSYTVSETEKETTQSKKLPKWVLPLNKFIALPNGLRVKSHSDPSDSSSPPRGRSVPLKAVPLDDPISTGIVSDDQLHVYISSPQDTQIQTDPFICIDRGFQTSTPRSVTPDISGASTPRGIITPRGSLSSADSAKGRISKYRQRSSSTPPDFGRRQPLPEKIGFGNGLSDRSGTDQTNNGWYNSNLDVFNDSITTVSTDSSTDIIEQVDNFTSSGHRERSASFGGPASSAGHSSDLRFCFDFNHIPAGRNVIVTPHYAPPHNSGIIKHRDMDKMNMESGSGIVNDMEHVNGSIPGEHSKSVLIYRPSNSDEVIMMGNHAEPWQNYSGYELSTLDNVGTNLLHARATFSSMPTVLSSKGDKKLIKILRKQEKEERKRIEKEEKKRAKEEKKRKKLEQKLLNKTLPRNWNYVNRPIESVYSRQKLSLSTVPIDFEDGPRNSPPPTTAPPPPPQPSLRTRSLYSSAPDLLRLEQIYGGASVSSRVSEHSPRTVVLQKGSEGFGFVLRGAKSQLKPNGELDFRPTNEFPALQYLDNVDAGSPSDKAGLKPGDFILEINGENVVRASHDRVVNLIRASGNTLAMKVVTICPTGRSQDWFVHQNHSKTMPNRKKKAPEPPRRDPQTSLSYSRAEGQNISEEMKAMEKFDKTISGERKDSTTSTEQKTASIRGRHAVKRVSCIDTENLEVDQQKSNHISPSEARINKYHKGQNGALERSKSNPDLSGKAVYATPQVPDSANSSSGLNGTRVYDLPHGGQQSQPSPTNSRPNIAPPQPPSPGSNKSQRKQAPSPPTGEAEKSEVVSITTNRKSQYVSVPHLGKPIEGSQFESSFRPGTSAKLTEEPTATVPSLEQSKLKPGHTRSSSTGAGLLKMVTVPLSNTPKEDSGEKRTLAEDKVRDSAADIMKSYPSAQLLVTADVHNSIMDKKNSKPHEPEPDYDIDSGDEKKNFEPKAQVSAENNHKVTLISVGVESKTKPVPSRNRYTIHSTIPIKNPEESIEIQDVFIPPRPAGPAPIPPKNEERTWVGSRRSSFQSESSQPNSGNSSPRDMEVRMQKDVLVPPPPPLPPTAPPPPPVPPSPKSEIRFGHLREMNADKPALPTEDILAAVAKRKERLEVDGPRITMNKPEVKSSPRDRTQLAILEAVAKRRTALQHKSETAVVDSIETQLQKTKKLQAAKFSFVMNQRSNPSSETNVKVSTNDNSKSYEATDKVQSKPNFLPVNSKPTRTEEKSKQPVKADIKSSHPTTKPVELSIKIGAKSPGDSLPSMTELKPKILQKSDSTKTKHETPLQKPDIKKEATKTNNEVQNVGKHEEKTHDTEVQLRPKKSDETGQNGDDKSNRNSDFVQLAEIKRQEWLQRKASQYNKSNSSSKQTSPDTSKPGSPDRSWKKGLIQIKPVSDKSIGSTVIMKDATTDQSNTDTKVKGQTLNGDVNHNDRNRQSKNVNSVKSPPSAFRDRKEVNTFVQLEIIPPPSSFLSESSTDIHDINNHHSNGPSFSPDSASIVSSLSTLSSLSGDHNDTNPHGYEDMIAPPPPGFDDGTNSADNFDQVARVIPPPPEFGNGYSSDKSARPFTSKPVESWLCNDVLDWLDSLNMGQYKSSFQQNSIDGKNLLSFTRNNYIELGVTQVGHRMNLERSIKKLAMHQSHSNIIESERL